MCYTVYVRIDTTKQLIVQLELERARRCLSVEHFLFHVCQVLELKERDLLPTGSSYYRWRRQLRANEKIEINANFQHWLGKYLDSREVRASEAL